MLATIDETQERILNGLKSLGAGWHDRAELADAMGKRKLNPVEALALEMLAENKKVEAVDQPIVSEGRGRNITRRVYRVRG